MRMPIGTSVTSRCVRFVLPAVLACAALALAPLSAPAADNEPPPGFVSLFNGRDLSGWKLPEGDNGHWKVVEGAIDYDAQSESSQRVKSLWSEKEYGDFIFMVDWRLKE